MQKYGEQLKIIMQTFDVGVVLFIGILVLFLFCLIQLRSGKNKFLIVNKLLLLLFLPICIYFFRESICNVIDQFLKDHEAFIKAYPRRKFAISVGVVPIAVGFMLDIYRECIIELNAAKQGDFYVIGKVDQCFLGFMNLLGTNLCVFIYTYPNWENIANITPSYGGVSVLIVELILITLFKRNKTDSIW